MPDHYNCQERDVIDAAWAELQYLADCCDHTMGPQLREAYRQDRKARETPRVSRLLLLNAAACYTEKTATELYGLSPAIIVAACIGGGLKKREAPRFLRWTVERAAPAKAAHNAAHRRRMDALHEDG